MLVRNKKTGEVFTIASYATVPLEVCDSQGNPKELRFEDIELVEEKKEEDWGEFRKNVAREILPKVIEVMGATDPEEVADMTILYVDELIKGLIEG